MIVVITDEAYEDLRRIGDYIAHDSPTAADQSVERLLAACETIGDTPLAWPFLQHHRASGIRRRLVGNYLIFYRIVAERIDVVHILHGAMDYESILFPDDPA